MSYTWPAFYQPDVVRGAFGGGRLSSYCIALEAWRRGLRVTLTHPRLFYFEVSDGEQTVQFNNSKPSPLTTDEAFQMVENKSKTTEALRAAGVAAPVTIPFSAATTSFDEVAEAAENFGYPVVLKPISGSKGNGVIAGIPDKEQLKDSHDWLVNAYGAKTFVLEKFFEGGDHRVYVVGNQFVAAGIKIPAHVDGDGKSTVGELIDQKNKNRLINPFLSEAPIKRDFEVDAHVSALGYTYDSVPDQGERVKLREKANASAGGDFHDRTDEMPDHIKQAAVRSVQAIPGLAAAGVDVLYDPSKPEGQDYVIIELNGRAHIGLNMYPTHGTGRDIPAAILDAYFPDSERLKIEGLETLRINLRDVTAPLRSKSADAVIVRPVPTHGMPHRVKQKLESLGDLTLPQRNRIITASRKHGVSGSLNMRTGDLIVGGVEDDVRKFQSSINRITGKQVKARSSWGGAIAVGFTITDTTAS